MSIKKGSLYIAGSSTTGANTSLSNLDEAGEARFTAKQDKLVAGTNITIDEETNTISSTGGATWLVVDELPENPEPNVFYGIKE